MNSFDPITTGPEVRYGRILGDHITANGLNPIAISAIAEYWSSDNSIEGFRPNTIHTKQGACDFAITPSYFNSGNTVENLGNIAASDINIGSPSDWVSGISMINITAPLNTNSGPGDHLNGRIPLTLDVPDYLYYDYVGDGQYYSPKASATIGSSESDIIFKRQGYR